MDSDMRESNFLRRNINRRIELQYVVMYNAADPSENRKYILSSLSAATAYAFSIIFIDLYILKQ